MKKLFNSFNEAAIERIKSPLISSFSISWVLLNWKIIVYVSFGKYDDADLLIEKIDSYLSITTSLIYPFLIAMFYAIAYPLINYQIFKMLNGRETKAKLSGVSNSISILKQKVIKAELQSQINEFSIDFDKKMQAEKLKNDHDLEMKKLQLEEAKIGIEEMKARNSRHN